MKPFPLKSGMRQGCLLSPLLLNIVLEFLARAIRQEQAIKGIQVGKEIVKLSLFTDDMILYLKDHKNSTKNLLEIINSYSKVAGYKITYRNQKLFYIPTTHRQRRKPGKQSLYTIPSKTVKYLRINLTKETKALLMKTINH
jgi:hypothetical protein